MNDTTTTTINEADANAVDLSTMGIQDMVKLPGSDEMRRRCFAEVERRIANRNKAGKKLIPAVVEFRNKLAENLGEEPIPVPSYSVRDRIETAFPADEDGVAEMVITHKLDPAKVIAALTRIVAGQ